MSTIHFETRVKIRLPYSDTERYYTDFGLLMLPDSYSVSGEKTRLIISCHGAGGTVTTDDAQVENQAMTKYFLTNGYAVMDVNGLPEDFAAEFGIDLRNNIGAPFAVESYINAYKHCVQGYNLKKEVFVHGGSMGGISSTNLVLGRKTPVLAQTCFCPVLDTYNEIFLHPWSAGLPKIALAKIYSFCTDESGEYIYDEEKLAGFNPAKSSVIHPCPVLFCHSADDPIVSPEITKRYVEKAKAQGVKAELFTLPGGEHEPQGFGEPVKNPSGCDSLNGEKINITQGMDAVLAFIKKYDR